MNNVTMSINDRTVVKKIIVIAASPVIMAVCLISMICMVVSGTVYEASHGLLAARELFFESWMLLIFGIVPIPGIKLIALILLINLLCRSIPILRYPVKNSGLIVLHCGVAMLLTGSLLASKMAQEYTLPLGIGEISDTALNFDEEELVIHHAGGNDASVSFTDTVIPVKHLHIGKMISLGNETLIVDAIGKYKNSMQNGENSKHRAEITLSHGASCQSASGTKIVVSNELPAQKVLCRAQTIAVEIRPFTKKLPVHITLKDFSKQLHQGTQTLKYVQSNVEIKGDNFVRDAVITMNKPLRFKNYTFYQSSYSEQQGKIYSSFSVVYNPYKITPYIASLTIICGGLLHAILLIIAGKRKRGINSDTL